MSQETNTQFWGHRGLPCQIAQRQERRTMAQKIPPVEEENPRVKCRDCAAFGHTSRSRRCPIKFPNGFLVPKLQTGRMEKENRDPGRPQTQDTLCLVERDKRHDSGQRYEEKQKKAPFLKLPLQIPRRNQHIHLADPKMLGFIGGNLKRALPDGPETTKPPVKKPRGRQRYPGNPPIKSFGSFCFLPSRQEEGHPMPVPGVPKPAFLQDCRKSISKPPSFLKLPVITASHPRDVPKGNALNQGFRMEPKDKAPITEKPRLPSRSALVPARPCTESQEPLAQPVAGQSLRMTFTRIQGDFWTCRFVQGSPGLPIDKQRPPSDDDASQGKVEGASSQVPRSVLYEDLLVSSSSEDSDGE